MFGSFFTESVQAMIVRAPWADPPLPGEVQKIREDVSALKFTCGDGARSQFLVDLDEFTFVNHGAFGATMRCVLQEVRCWQEYCELQPLRFMDRCSSPQYPGHMLA
jgi:isopenicillin-N epimerase